MAEKYVPKLIVTAEANGVRVVAYGRELKTLDDKDGYELHMPFRAMPPEWRERWLAENPDAFWREVTFWIPKADAVSVEATELTYEQWRQSVLPPKSAIPDK